MQYKKILLIINPKAGVSKNGHNVFDIIETFCKNDCLTTTLTTLKAGDAIRLVSENAKDHDMVVCAGGDGTLNETVSALLKSGVDIPIGYIPSGSTNDMARTLSIPKKPVKAAELIANGRLTPFDVGVFGEDKYFCYTASFGAFTRISYTTPRKLKNIFGHFAYLLDGIAKMGVELVPIHAKVTTDTFESEGDFLLGGMFNARSVAGLIKLDRCGVETDDGRFELMLIRKPKNPNDLYKIIRSLNRQKFDDDHIIFKKVDWAEFEFDKPVGWSLDGENGGQVQKVFIKNKKHAVSIFGKAE